MYVYVTLCVCVCPGFLYRGEEHRNVVGRLAGRGGIGPGWVRREGVRWGFRKTGREKMEAFLAFFRSHSSLVEGTFFMPGKEDHGDDG